MADFLKGSYKKCMGGKVKDKNLVLSNEVIK